MDYEFLEEAGTLEVKLVGDHPDLDALGFFQVHFQEIIDRVSYWVAIEGGLVPPAIPGGPSKWLLAQIGNLSFRNRK